MTGGDNEEFGEDGKQIAGHSDAGHSDNAAPGWHAGADHTAADAVEHEHGLPGIHHEDRLPWLESGEEDLAEGGVDAKRVWAFVLAGLALLALIVGGVWWTTHRGENGPQLADGSTVPAPPGAYKDAPQNPGGKTFDGTGDSSFAVSQGHRPDAKLASGGDGAAGAKASGDSGKAVGAKAASEAGNPSGGGGGGGGAGGIGVQIGAFSSQAAAEAAWSKLSKAYDVLSGTSHRIVEGKVDIGTVYRLQAVTGSDDAAKGLCDKLKAAGLNCQVKD